MQPRIVITGLGAVSPAGVGSASLFDALVAGRGLIAELGTPWAEPPHQLGAAVHDTGARGRIPPARLRRIGRLSQMALVAAADALAQSGPSQPGETGVVLGTGFGALEETVAFIGELASQGPAGANPALFPASVMNIAAAQVSMELNLQGYNTTVNHKEISTEMAVQLAADVLRLGHAERILAGGVDELSHPLHHGYRRLHALSSARPRPYRVERDGVCLGEGAALAALETRERARARGATILAELAGLGAAGGVRPLTSWGLGPGALPAPSIDAGVTAIKAALEDASIEPERVSLVIGSGSGSRELDQLEGEVLRRALPRGDLLLTSPHGSIGTFPAAGALRLASAVEVLARGRVYPTLGEGELDPVCRAGRLVERALDHQPDHVLLVSHATGGGSAALLLRRGES